MDSFKYRAKDANGRSVTGVMQATDLADLQNKLKLDNKYLISANVVVETRFSKRLKSNQVSDFCRNIGQLIAAGITLVRALRIIAEDESIKPKEREVYKELQKQVQSGTPLSDCMENLGGAFPPLLINMFRSAETAGNIDKVSMQMAEYFDKEFRLTTKVKNAMTYPKILVAMMIVVLLIIMGYVIPQFQSLFATMGELPLPTRVLLAISDFVLNRWYVLIFACVIIYAVIKLLTSIPKVRVFLYKVELHLPLIGKLRKIIYTARFARTLSSLYAAGIPILGCLDIAKATIGNDYIEKQFEQLIFIVRNGGNLSEAVDSVDGFTKKLVSTIRVGEETGALDNMLVNIADQMEYESEMALNRLVSYLEPVMIVALAVMVGFIIIAVIQPIYGSYAAISSSY